MRLLDTETGHFVEKDPEDRSNTVYAILSHTWDNQRGEQTYKELERIQQRYRPGRESQATQTHRPSAHQSCTSASSPAEHDCNEPSTALTPSPLLNGSPSVITRTLTTLVCLIQSELGALRAFVEAYGLANLIPTPAPASPPAPGPAPTPAPAPAPAPSDRSPRTPDPPSQPPPQSIWDDPELSPKIRHACRVARENGYRYIWIDSCCIDKSSSSELSEAINSMYRWYAFARVCYAYLADVPSGQDPHTEGSRFRSSRWFRRGWTLQELIAPIHVEFLSANWAPIGTKHTLVDLVEQITEIQCSALLHLESLDSFSVIQRFSWSARRKTTRVEDRAYSLLGIFDINMQTLYGEGDRAFRRLQEHIMQRIPDQSLFAWGHVYLGPQFHSREPRDDNIEPHDGLVFECSATWRCISAPDADTFMGCKNIRSVELPTSLRHEIVYTLTSYGIRTQFQLIPLTDDLISAIFPYGKIKVSLPNFINTHWYLAILGCEHVKKPGHLLGHLCYVYPSDSGVDAISSGLIGDATTYDEVVYSLFPLSPEIIESCRPDMQVKTVYISHPKRDQLLSVIRSQPHVSVKLVLLRRTCDVLRSRGYAPNFRSPDPDHPATHRLTLSKHEHTITIDIKHALAGPSHWYTTALTAEVMMSVKSLAGDYGQVYSAPESGPDWATPVSTLPQWSQTINSRAWPETHGFYRVRLSAAGERAVVVRLGVDFVGALVFILHVDVFSDPPAASPVGEPLAVDQA